MVVKFLVACGYLLVETRFDDETMHIILETLSEKQDGTDHLRFLCNKVSVDDRL